jgi:hypothetical protein
MNLDPFIETLRRELLAASGAGPEETRAVAERLTMSLDAAARLVLLEALSAAASEITLELVPGSVDVRLRGRDPEFSVTLPPAVPPAEDNGGTESPVADTRLPTTDGGDGGTARMTLRLTEQMKLRIEEAAGRQGLSVNAWLGRVIAAALRPKERHPGRGPPVGRRFTGWVR